VLNSRNLKSKYSKIFTSAICSLALVACSDSDDSNSVSYDYGAVVLTAVYGSGSALQVIDLEQDMLVASEQINIEVGTNYGIAASGTHFYQIGRSGIDTIEKYSIEDTSEALYSYSTNANEEDESSNTYTIVTLNDTKAYLINYGNDKIYVVNPSAEDEANFITGSIDISAYGDTDGVPEAADAVIIDDRLFVIMQRLTGFSPGVEGQSAYVAVYDTATDTEIDTNTSDDSANLKGIEMDIRNLNKIQYVKGAGLFVQGNGDFYGGFRGRENLYTSGIVKIDTSNYSVSSIIDDGESANDAEHLYGFIYKMAILDKNNGYFVGAPSYDNGSLYHFNPSTGTVTGEVSMFDNYRVEGKLDIGLLETGPQGNAWVGITNDADPRLLVIDADQQEQANIELELNAIGVAFTETPLP
jgi:hypothetical protein